MLPDNSGLICIFTYSSITIFLHFYLGTINSPFGDMTANSTLFSVFLEVFAISCNVY